MRTTITIDEEILDQLKARAAKEATTVSRLIEDSVRLAAKPSDKPVVKPFKLVTFGKGDHFTRLDVNRSSALIERDDIAKHGRPG